MKYRGRRLRCLLSLVAFMGSRVRSSATNGLRTEAVVDANGNLRVPADYRTAYQFLGSWAVAADQAKVQKTSMSFTRRRARSAAYRKDGRFPDGSVLVKEVFEATTAPMTTGTVSHAQN